MQVVSHGLKLIIINDIDNNFLPVLSTNFSNFKITMDKNAKQFCIWTDLTISVNFFNVTVGVWEPFIEQFTMNLMTSTEVESNKQNLSVTVATPFNINLTEKLVQNLYESNKSWQIVSANFELY